MKGPLTPPEFSRVVQADRVESTSGGLALSATAEEREGLARRYGILGVERLDATVRLHWRAGGQVVLDGEFDADVVQSCVVTLEPVAGHVADSFQVVFDPEAPREAIGEDIEVMQGEELGEDLEPLVDGRIDVGEMVAQYLALSLEPYPRRPEADAVLAEAGDGEPEDGSDDDHAGAGSDGGPFAALRRLKGHG